MITLEFLERVKLSRVPYGQLFVAYTFLTPLYKVKNVEIVFEGRENLLDRPVIFIMNHTDRYNYWPFQYHLYFGKPRHTYPFIATWVKGKYYEHPLLAFFMNMTNNIPIPSRGYLLAKDFQYMFGKKAKMTEKEYRLLRDYVDGKIEADVFKEEKMDRLLKLISTPHGDFDPAATDYRTFINETFYKMMQKVRELNEEALFDKDLNLLVFPEGTRSKRLKEGHIGVAEVALSTKVPVIPVGCNGSDKCYPGDSPIIEKNCRIVYRIRKPLHVEDELKEYRIDEDFVPFTPEAEKKYRDKFEGAINLMMRKINELLDPEYQMDEDTRIKTGMDRFI